MNRSLVAVGLGFLCLGVTGALSAQQRKTALKTPTIPVRPAMYISETKRVLYGLRGVRVRVGAPSDEMEKLGLPQSRIERAVSDNLRRHGVPVMTEEEVRKAVGSPTLWISITDMQHAFRISVEHREDILLMRQPSTTILAAITWQKDAIGTGMDAEHITKSLQALVDLYADDYVAANPK